MRFGKSWSRKNVEMCPAKKGGRDEKKFNKNDGRIFFGSNKADTAPFRMS